MVIVDLAVTLPVGHAGQPIRLSARCRPDRVLQAVQVLPAAPAVPVAPAVRAAVLQAVQAAPEAAMVAEEEVLFISA